MNKFKKIPIRCNNCNHCYTTRKSPKRCPCCGFRYRGTYDYTDQSGGRY